MGVHKQQAASALARQRILASLDCDFMWGVGGSVSVLRSDESIPEWRYSVLPVSRRDSQSLETASLVE
jgi:hypothetical protein